MKFPDLWRRAMLDRAQELNQEPKTAILEFWAVVLEPPKTISKAEARELAKDYPWTERQIFEAFTIEAT
jgi:alkylhydroperoxidase family enzyme